MSYDEVTGTITYFFITDDTVLTRMRAAYPTLTLDVVGDLQQYPFNLDNTELTVTGKWMDVFNFLVAEYGGCDADDALDNVAAFKPTFLKDEE